jgi:hypothetical protein
MFRWIFTFSVGLQIADLQEKYHECFEILMENQQEMKCLNQKIE